MKTEDKVALLVEEIVRILAEGYALSPDAGHFIESTFPAMTPAELAESISAGEDSDFAPLVELVFFPDEGLQARLEGTLSRLELDAGDENAVAVRLAERQPVALISCAGWGSAAFRFTMPAEAAAPFVARLKIGRKLPETIARAIARRVAEADRNPLRVKLRNARIPFSVSQENFICDLLAKLPTGEGQFAELMAFALELLAELAPDAEMREGLIAKKKFHFQNYQRAEQMAEQIKGRNMETLMLQGVRMPYVDKNDALCKMGLVDRICIALYGRSVYFERVYGGRDMGTFLDKNEMDQMVRLLS